jgi:hypothetical protein
MLRRLEFDGEYQPRFRLASDLCTRREASSESVPGRIMSLFRASGAAGRRRRLHLGASNFGARDVIIGPETERRHGPCGDHQCSSRRSLRSAYACQMVNSNAYDASHIFAVHNFAIGKATLLRSIFEKLRTSLNLAL